MIQQSDLKIEMAKLLSGILNEEVDPNRPDATIVEDYSADSMDMVEVADSIEDTFDIEVSNDDIQSIVTFGDAVKFVETKR